MPGFAGAQLPSSVPTLAPMIERVSPAVVNISVSGVVRIDSPFAEDPLFRRFFPENDRPVQSAGSGVIVDAENGYILTNHHVVANADEITVTLFDSRSLDAQVIGSDEGSDIAVLQVAADSLAQIELADSDRLRVGDFVVAIGNPFGLSHTVTSGIVSGLGRSNINPDAYENFIQTDASINPGNSGGALVDLTGSLVGVNSAIISRGGGNIGIGFAIPANMARNVMEQLIAHGEVRRGLLGVSINDVSADIAATYGLKDTSGALVMAVSPDSAAEKAGIEVNDVIVSVNDRRVRDAGSLRAAIGLMRPGDRVDVGIVRDGRERTIAATLGSAADVPRAFATPATIDDSAFEGAQFSPTDAPGPQGLTAIAVAPGSPAYERGLRAGDVVTSINRQSIRTVAEAEAVIAGARSVILMVQRDSRELLLLMR
ncbi:MAG: DegQ family serine endoprotease [Gammaproteobacteria bacterium]|nr:DegQ family serine endoprotease [Gammaproteobacteria bacterium]